MNIRDDQLTACNIICTVIFYFLFPVATLLGEGVAGDQVHGETGCFLVSLRALEPYRDITCKTVWSS